MSNQTHPKGNPGATAAQGHQRRQTNIIKALAKALEFIKQTSPEAYGLISELEDALAQAKDPIV
jgi:hypothetical protein